MGLLSVLGLPLPELRVILMVGHKNPHLNLPMVSRLKLKGHSRVLMCKSPNVRSHSACLLWRRDCKTRKKNLGERAMRSDFETRPAPQLDSFCLKMERRGLICGFRPSCGSEGWIEAFSKVGQILGLRWNWSRTQVNWSQTNKWIARSSRSKNRTSARGRCMFNEGMCLSLWRSFQLCHL